LGSQQKSHLLKDGFFYYIEKYLVEGGTKKKIRKTMENPTWIILSI